MREYVWGDDVTKNDVVTKEALIYVLDFLDSTKIRYWIEGGWGIDILLGKQNRDHRDLDVDFDAAYTDDLLKRLKDFGYRVVLDARPTRVELQHPTLSFLDLHPLILNDDGSARQVNPQGGWFEFDAKWFISAAFEGRIIPCFSVEAQQLFHSGYELREVDKIDMKNLELATKHEQTLRDPNIAPTSEVISQALRSSNSVYVHFISTLPDLGIQLNWRYYTDGKAWLAKGTTSWTGSRGGQKELTVFWLSMWKGFFKVTIYFPEVVRSDVLNQSLNHVIKQKIIDAKPMGKLNFFPVVFNVRYPEELDDLMALINIRKAFR